MSRDTLPIANLFNWRPRLAILSYFEKNDPTIFLTLERASRRGTISPELADRVTIALGTHIDIVWPNEYPVLLTPEERKEKRRLLKNIQNRKIYKDKHAPTTESQS